MKVIFGASAPTGTNFMKTLRSRRFVQSLGLGNSRRILGLMRLATAIVAVALLAPRLPAAAAASQLWAGVAKVDITVPGMPLANEPWYVAALVIGNETTRAVIVSVDAVAVAEIGSIRNDYIGNVRAQLQQDLKILPKNIMFNATHRHGSICADIEQRTIRAVKEAWANMVPVSVGAGAGHEDKIMENRRVRLKNGREADLRHAYALPADSEIAGIGPVDPEIGVIRLDRKNGQPLAVLFNFAMHPNLSSPHGANSADVNGFAAKVIEENLGNGAVALFVQGCAGDVAPILYKDYTVLRDPEPLGNRLGLSTLRAVKKIQTQGDISRDVARIGAAARSSGATDPRVVKLNYLKAAEVSLRDRLKSLIDQKKSLPLGRRGDADRASINEQIKSANTELSNIQPQLANLISIPVVDIPGGQD